MKYFAETKMNMYDAEVHETKIRLLLWMGGEGRLHQTTEGPGKTGVPFTPSRICHGDLATHMWRKRKISV